MLRGEACLFTRPDGSNEARCSCVQVGSLQGWLSQRGVDAPPHDLGNGNLLGAVRGLESFHLGRRELDLSSDHRGLLAKCRHFMMASQDREGFPAPGQPGDRGPRVRGHGDLGGDPAPSLATRSPQNGWTKKKGTTTVGRPARSEVATVPTPPWWTTADILGVRPGDLPAWDACSADGRTGRPPGFRSAPAFRGRSSSRGLRRRPG